MGDYERLFTSSMTRQWQCRSRVFSEYELSMPHWAMKRQSNHVHSFRVLGGASALKRSLLGEKSTSLRIYIYQIAFIHPLS